jgi:hypothetical protein
MTSTLNTLKSNTGSRKKKLRKGRGIAAWAGSFLWFWYERTEISIRKTYSPRI